MDHLQGRQGRLSYQRLLDGIRDRGFPVSGLAASRCQAASPCHAWFLVFRRRALRPGQHAPLGGSHAGPCFQGRQRGRGWRDGNGDATSISGGDRREPVYREETRVLSTPYPVSEALANHFGTAPELLPELTLRMPRSGGKSIPTQSMGTRQTTRSHAPAWERTSCRSAARPSSIREVVPGPFLCFQKGHTHE